MADALEQTNRHMAENYSAESTLEGSQDRGGTPNPRKRRGSQPRAKDQHTRQERETTEGTNHGAKGPPMQLDGAVGREKSHIPTGNHHFTM